MKRFKQFTTIDEVSTKTLVNYVAKASTDVGRRIEKAEPGVKPFKKLMQRSSKIGRAKAHIQMRTNESTNDACHVCGQTPCNCTHIEEGAELNRGPQRPSKYTDPRADLEMKATKKEYEHRAKHFAAAKAGDQPTADKEHKRMRKFQSIAHKINKSRSSGSNYGDAIAKDYKDQENKRGIGHVRDSVELDGNLVNEISQELKNRYVERAVTAHGGYNMARRNTTGAQKEYFARKEANTQKGISRALKKEEVEQISELSKGTIQRYKSHAVLRAVGHASNIYDREVEGGKKPDPKQHAALAKANKNLERANARLAKEDVEQVSELKISTLTRYGTKANQSSVKLGVEAERAMDAGDRETAAKKFTKRDSRYKGIMKARAKIQAQAQARKK